MEPTGTFFEGDEIEIKMEDKDSDGTNGNLSTVIFPFFF